MAKQKIELVFDFNTQDVQIATDKTLSLTQQLRILKRELQKTDEGTQEFDILKNKINDTEDSVSRVNTKSKEFFSTLSLIPGPIGDIANRVDGAIGLLKTFSSFSLKDITSQFKALGSDLIGIVNNFLGLNKTQKDVIDANGNLTSSNNDVSSSFKSVDSNSINAAKGIQEQVDAQQKSLRVNDEAIKGLKDKIDTEKQLQSALGGSIEVEQAKLFTLKKGTEEYNKSKSTIEGYNSELQNSIAYEQRYSTELTKKEAEQKKATAAINGTTTSTEVLTVATNAETGAAATNTVATNTQSFAMRALAAAENAASVAGTVLKAVLAGLGIGLLITGLSMLITYVGEWVMGTDKAAGANKKLNDVLKEQQRILDNDIKAVDNATKLNVLRAKIAGKTEEEIFQIQKQGGIQRLNLLRQAEGQILNEQRKLARRQGDYARIDEEQRAQLAIEYRDKALKASQDVQDQIIANEEAGLTEQLRIVEKGRKNNKTAEEIAKEKLEALKANLDAQIQLEIDAEKRGEKTRADVLKDLLDKRLQAELTDVKKSEAEKELLRQQYSEKLKTALNDDAKVIKDRRVAELDALIQLEKDKGVEGLATSREALQTLLNQRMEFELLAVDGVEKSEAEKAAIRAKYAKQLEDEIKKDIDKQNELTFRRLSNELDALDGNYEAQVNKFVEIQKTIETLTGLDEQKKFQLRKDFHDRFLQILDEGNKSEADGIKAKYGQFAEYSGKYYKEMQAKYAQDNIQLKDALDKKLITQTEYDTRIAANQVAQIELDKQQAVSKEELAGVVSNALGQVAEIVGRDTAAGKALAIAQATIDTYAGASKALAAYPPPFNFIAAGAVVVAGLLNVKKIISTKVPGASDSSAGSGETAKPPTIPINVNAVKRAKGGIINRAEGGDVVGEGTETSDSIPAMLSDGEFVINARSTKVFRPLLSAINNYGNIPAFAAGGSVMRSNTKPGGASNETLIEKLTDSISNRPIQTYVVSNLMSNQQQFDRTIKSRSLI
jgi:uncharacterized protein YeaO (DUF488 family)